MADYYGDETRWFIGYVVNNVDPLKLDRVKVRIIGIHTENTEDIDDDDLPWAQVNVPVTEDGSSGQGANSQLKVRAQVFGIFLDGKDSQLPLILGSLPKYEESSPGGISTNQLATGTNTIAKTPNPLFLGADASPYAAQYPHNKVTQTTSGHVIEIDDTPGAERIQVYHKSGTCVHFHPNGDVVTQTANGFKTVTGNEKIHVKGNMEITCDGNFKVRAARIDLN